MDADSFSRYRSYCQSQEQGEANEDNYQWTPRVSEDQDDLDESDHTDEIDFSDSDTFEEVIDKVRKNELNRIGIGKYREGWHHPFDKRLVIKYATPRDDTNDLRDCQVRNFWEFMVWHKCLEEQLPELEYLMPCKDCAPDGSWMTQQKGRRVPKDKSVSIKGEMQWVGDRSKTNYAMLGDEIKSIDYATTKAMEHLGLPQDYDRCQKIVIGILEKKGDDYRSPDYGKSTPHEDPTLD